MQRVSSTYLAALKANNQTAKRLTVVVELYSADALPGADGFDPASSDCIKRWAKVEGVTFRGLEYERLLSPDTITGNKTFKKQLSDASFSLDNSTRQVIDFEREFGFEGLIVVIREIDRITSADLLDSDVWFTGRCEKPDSFDRSSEKVKITAKQILNQTEINIPRRKFSTDDEQGRAPSDPLFEGFRFSQRTAEVRYTERVRRGGFLGALGLSKNVSRFVQYSSHSDATAEQFVPVVLGRASTSVIHLGYLDYGTWLHGTAAVCDGEVKGYENIRAVTPGFSLPNLALKYGKPGIAGTVDTPTGQANDDPDFVGAGVYSRLAYLRYVALGTKIDVEDPAPEIALIVLGMLMPLPDETGAFNRYDFSDNPVHQSRWLLNSPDYFDLSSDWFDDAEIADAASYCDHILVDQTNSETVAFPSSEIGQVGSGAYRNFSSTARLSPAYFAYRSGVSVAGETAFLQQVDYQFYDDVPLVGDDWDGDGVPDYEYNATPTVYRRRYTSNVVISEQQKALDFLFDVIFPTFNGYLVQKASGKLAVKAFRPVDFAFVRTASIVGATEIHATNVNPFAEEPGRIVIGAHTDAAEVREITGTRYDTSVSITITASGGLSVSGATLAGGSNSVAPHATVTVSSASGTKSLNIAGYALTYAPQTGETTITAAGMLAALVNSHNELNKFIKAVWTPGEASLVVSSRIGYLELDAPLENAHLAAIADPTAAPVLTPSGSGGFFQAGAYQACYSYLTETGETLTSPNGTVTVSELGKINFPEITLPARALQVRWYLSVEPNGIRLRHAQTNAGEAFTLTQPPSLDAAVEPITNTTAEEMHRVAMAFSDRPDTSANLRASNMLKGTFKFPLGRKQASTNRIDIKYRDASQDFALSELRVKDAAHIKKVKKVNAVSVNGAAIDSTNQARRIANQKLAILRDGDMFHGFTSDGEALLLEEGDVITVNEDSGRFKNESIRIEEVTISDNGGYPEIQITGRKYRRYFFDDQIQEKLVPLAIVTTAEPNTETGAPRIYQQGGAQTLVIAVAVENYTANAKYRKVQVASTNAFVSPVEINYAAQYEANRILSPIIQLTRQTNLNVDETKYVRVAHSSNGQTFGAWSNVLTIIYPDEATGIGGSSGGTPEAPSGGGSGGGYGTCPALDQFVTVKGANGQPEARRVSDVTIDDSLYNPIAKTFERLTRADVIESELYEVCFENGVVTRATASHPLIADLLDTKGSPIAKLNAGDESLTDLAETLRGSRIIDIEYVGRGKAKHFTTAGETHIYESGAVAGAYAVCHNSKISPIDSPGS